MTIDLYKVFKDNRCLDKITNSTKINLNPVTLAPTSKIDLIKPTFEIDMNTNYIKSNYVYCSELDRYYYIDKIAINTAQRLELTCTVDVRQSFMTAIKSTSAIITRAEQLAQPTQIIDSKLPVNPSNKIITSIILPETSNSLNTNAEYSYLLTVIGGTPAV